jgi:hypothetical protein
MIHKNDKSDLNLYDPSFDNLQGTGQEKNVNLKKDLGEKNKKLKKI